jgi:hypothetical protein
MQSIALDMLIFKTLLTEEEEGFSFGLGRHSFQNLV